jgi:hypothetical protein
MVGSSPILGVLADFADFAATAGRIIRGSPEGERASEDDRQQNAEYPAKPLSSYETIRKLQQLSPRPAL